MAKVAKPKKDPLNNPRSRASRRAAPAPLSSTHKSPRDDNENNSTRPSDAQPALAPYRGAGIQKKQKKKQTSHGQRVRHAKGLARAEMVQDQLAAKVADAKSRSKKVQLRRALWDDINAGSKDETRKTIRGPGRFDSLLGEDGEDGEIQPFHGDTEIKVIDGVLVPAFATGHTFTMSLGPAVLDHPRKVGEPLDAGTTTAAVAAAPATVTAAAGATAATSTVGDGVDDIT